jgi:type IV pilus assembly protein PilW
MGTPTVRRTRRPVRAAGRTLVELMISLAIGLAVTAAVATAYLSATRTARVAGELAGIADTGQVAMLLIGDAIRQAGYGEIVGSELALGADDVGAYRTQTLFAEGAHLAGCAGGRFVDDTVATPVCAPPSDVNFDALLVRFQADAMVPPAQGLVPDCLGGASPAEDLPATHVGVARAAARPVVQNAYYGAAGALMCRGNARALPGLAFAPPQQLVTDVEQFKVFYGFDDVRHANAGTTAGATVRSLRDAAWINALPPQTQPWEYVVSVHVCMVIRSAPDAGGGLSTVATQTWTRCPLNAAEAAGELPTVTASDGFLRRTYSQVFTVRARSTANPRQFLP